MMIAQTIPETLEAAIDSLYASLNDDEKAHISSPENLPGSMHHFGGMALRNGWNLWGARPEVSTVLCDHFKTRFGLGCADDMSGMILKGLWAKVRGEHYDANADAAYYHDFWRRARRDAMSGAELPPGPPSDNGFLRAPVPPRGRYDRNLVDRFFDFFGKVFRPRMA